MSFLILISSFIVFFILYLINKGAIKDDSWSTVYSIQNRTNRRTHLTSKPIKKDIKVSQEELEKLRKILSNKYSSDYLKKHLNKLIHLYDLSLSNQSILFFRIILSSYDEFEFTENETTKLYNFIRYLNKKNNSFLKETIELNEKPKRLTREYDIEKWREKKFYELDSYQDLFQVINDKPILEIKYSELLQCSEWKIKRFKILFRDKYKCQKCFSKSKHNHVHHKYYLKDKFPWEYEDNALETLCSKCHFETHKKENILRYQENQYGLKEVIPFYEICSRCNGTGHLPQYNYYQNGICFKCNGDTFSDSFFLTALKKAKEKKHDSSRILEEALSFIESITYDEFILTYPDVENYQFNKTKNIREYYNEDDDLPF